jgi:hypothetical protein
MLLPKAVRSTQLLRIEPQTIGSISPGLQSRPWLVSVILFAVAYVAYLAVGALIVFGSGSVPIDTWARVGNASYALYSRDPHLGAIGFVLPPVATLAIMPVLPFKAIWPALVTSAFAAPITSAAFMAGGVVLVRRILRDLAVPTWLTWLTVALFALHPMIVYYGGNGLTEAPFVFCLLWATSSLLRWLDRGLLADLVRLGMGLAIGYLTRYEFIAAAPVAVGLVAVVSYLRASGATSERRTGALADAVIAGLPFVVAFVGWAFVSWLLVGSPFAQFTSIYGNSSQVQILHQSVVEQTGQGTPAAIGYVAAQLLGLTPMLPVVGLFALVRAGTLQDQRILAPLAIIGGPLAFSVVAFLGGSTVGFLRYEIASIPLLVLLAGVVLAREGPAQRLHVSVSRPTAVDRIGARPTERLHVGLWRRARRWIGAVSVRFPTPPVRLNAAIRSTFGLLVAMDIALSLVTGLVTMRDPLLAREESDALRSLPGIDRTAAGTSYVLAKHAASARVAAAIDALDLSRGAILVDVATGNAIVLQSAHPDWFVITPDRDFERVLADPGSFGVRYLVVAANSGEDALDALNRAYPTLYATGGGFATLVGEYKEAGANGWRLYRIDQVHTGTNPR